MEMKSPDFSSLPEGCISYIISSTSPGDALRSSAVSSVFRTASDSDFVWERFLPGDYSDILSMAVTSLEEYSSKKELYFTLCNSVLIDDGKKVFWLEKSTGKKCYVLSSAELTIICAEGDTPPYWGRVDFPESRFGHVAELFNVCSLEIKGSFDSRFLSPKTTYAVYLILKIRSKNAGLDAAPVTAEVTLGDQRSVHLALLRLPIRSPKRPRTRRVPRVRGDGWMELELGQFFNDDGRDGEVEFRLDDWTESEDPKIGLIVDGIEIRPAQKK